jgi:hypothetical protein
MSLHVQTKRNQVVYMKVIFLFCPEVERNFVIIYNNASLPICLRQTTAIILHYNIFWWMPARGCVEQLENVRADFPVLFREWGKRFHDVVIELDWNEEKANPEVLVHLLKSVAAANQLMRGTKASIGTFQLHYLHGSEWKIVCCIVFCYFTHQRNLFPIRLERLSSIMSDPLASTNYFLVMCE